MRGVAQLRGGWWARAHTSGCSLPAVPRWEPTSCPLHIPAPAPLQRADLEKVKAERAALLDSLAKLRADVGKSGGELQQEDIRLLRRELAAKQEKLNELRRATHDLSDTWVLLMGWGRRCHPLPAAHLFTLDLPSNPPPNRHTAILHSSQPCRLEQLETTSRDCEALMPQAMADLQVCARHAPRAQCTCSAWHH